MKIKDLKEQHPAIYRRALECQVEQGNKPNDLLSLVNGVLSGNFGWKKTIEGFDFWKDIDRGNFQVFYDHYPEQAKEKYFSNDAADSAAYVINGGNDPRTRSVTEIGSREPKAGDMVEVSDNGEDYSKYSHHTHKYLGVKRFYDGFFVVENQDGFIACHQFIRLHQKSEVDSAIKSIKEEYYCDERSFDWALDKAVKWGQNNLNAK